jgi:hypothetical protein
MTELPRAERCETCRYWSLAQTVTVADEFHDEGQAAGLCRIRAPRLDPEGEGHPIAEVFYRGVWPATDNDDWCGEWRARDGAKVPAGRTQNHEWMSEFFNYHKGHLRIWNIIERTGVTSREELAAFGRAKLWEVNGCGATTIAIIADYLKSHGLTLAE